MTIGPTPGTQSIAGRVVPSARMALVERDIVEHIASLFRERGGLAYGESVTQLEHACQCASLAEREGASAALVAAALLHDVGHLLHGDAAGALKGGRDDFHEALGARYLARQFQVAVTQPVALHVPAKRYLCRVEPAYAAGLSEVSRQTLALQGGVMSEAEAERFAAMPFALDAVRVRRWDDAAKCPDLVTPSFDHFLSVLQASRRPR
jgi:phosphonate degradation associated HDIG domain protein